jgi:hypothetical protein
LRYEECLQNWGNATMTKRKREQYSSHKLTVSKATENDSADIWKWRNDTHTLQMSITTDEVSWEAHSSWYNNSLKNKNRYLYVGIIDTINKVGMCRFDIDENKNTAEVSINLNPDSLSTTLKNIEYGISYLSHSETISSKILRSKSKKFSR